MTLETGTSNVAVSTATSNMDGKEERKERRKRKRWGEKPPEPVVGENTAAASNSGSSSQPLATPASSDANDPKARLLAMQESIRARLAAAKAGQAVAGTMPPLTEAASSLPVKRAKVYELDLTVTAPTFLHEGASSATATAATATATAPAVASQKPALSSAPAATTSTAATKKKHSNPYLAHTINDGDDDDIQEDDEFIDDRLQRTSKLRKRHKELHFVEPGKWQEIAEIKRTKELKAVASGYTSGRKVGHTIQAPSLLSDAALGTATTTTTTTTSESSATSLAADHSLLAPRADAHPDTKMPLVMEWWDVDLLPVKLKKQVAALESESAVGKGGVVTPATSLDSTAPTTAAASETSTTDSGESSAMPPPPKGIDVDTLRLRCFEQASLSYSKTAALVQHICPIKPSNLVAAGPPKQAVLRLTKKEMKRQRKLRRQEKQREIQDLQAAGLVPAPEPRLTLRNFIQVLGDQAFLDPSQIERKVQEQMQARQQAHLERNAANKLTKEQRAAKRARLLAEDTTASVTTALFYVKDMSHPYHRTKVDLNAQQLNLSGCVLECAQHPAFACIIVEGGPKAIKRYSRLMLVRMKWTGLDDENEYDDEEDDAMDEEGDIAAGGVATRKFNPDNKCEFVWQGMVVKRLFHGFLFQACDTHDQARKILKAKGALHYWDQVLQHAQGQGGAKFQLRIGQLKDDVNDNDDDPEGFNMNVA